MAKQYTLGELRAMSVEDRDVLYRNALKLATPEAKEVVALMIAHDLLTTSRGGLPNHHPLILKIEEIARSQQGRDAARTAADNGLPALAGVDPLLKAALGDQYGPLGDDQLGGSVRSRRNAKARVQATRRARSAAGLRCPQRHVLRPLWTSFVIDAAWG